MGLNKKLEQRSMNASALRSCLYESQERLELALKGADLGLWDYRFAKERIFVDTDGV